MVGRVARAGPRLGIGKPSLADVVGFLLGDLVRRLREVWSRSLVSTLASMLFLRKKLQAFAEMLYTSSYSRGPTRVEVPKGGCNRLRSRVGAREEATWERAILGMFAFLFAWNDFFWPLIVLQTPDSWTAQVALRQVQNQAHITDFGVQFAATVLATLPLLIIGLVMGRQLVKGITEGAVKG